MLRFVAELLQVRSSIPIQCVCAVERVDENAFQQQNVMQLITQNNDGQLRIIYIQCKVTFDEVHPSWVYVCLNAHTLYGFSELV